MVCGVSIVSGQEYMMRKLILLTLLCLPMMVACSTGGPAFGEPGASITRVVYAPAGVYTFKYKADQVYGLAFARSDAIVKYLERNQGILPPDCSWGVQVLDIIDENNGESVASFKCDPVAPGSRDLLSPNLRVR